MLHLLRLSRCWIIPALLLCGCTQDRQQAPAHGLVWRVDGRHYLAGSMHMLRPSDYPLPATLERCYAEVGRVIFELAPDASTDADLQAAMRQWGLQASDQTLRQQISADCWQELEKWCAKRRFPITSFADKQPWLVSLQITSFEAGRVGARRELGVEKELERRSRADGKSRGGLESVERQMRLFADLDIQQQESLLQQTLLESQQAGRHFEQLLQAWRNGDLELLTTLLDQMPRQSGAWREHFLLQRNREWLPQIRLELDAREPVLIMVGTAHLIGEQSLIKLLEQAGHEIERVF